MRFVTAAFLGLLATVAYVQRAHAVHVVMAAMFFVPAVLLLLPNPFSLDAARTALPMRGLRAAYLLTAGMVATFALLAACAFVRALARFDPAEVAIDFVGFLLLAHAAFHIARMPPRIRRLRAKGRSADGDADARALEPLVLRLARERAGRITASEVAIACSVTRQDARAVLDALASEGACNVLIGQAGVPVYAFAEFSLPEAKRDILEPSGSAS
jgi:hypothetical protein